MIEKPDVYDGTVPVLTQHSLHMYDAATLPDILSQSGVLILLDKPLGWTSFDVVAKTRNTLRIKKVGHTGTLDPMATGLLILCLGKATKLVEKIQAGEKEYIGALRLGATTPSDDAESEVNETFPTEHITEEDIRSAAAGFVGTSIQIPPMYSARKVDGQRLYKIARKGQVIDRPAREITVREFDITDIAMPDVRFRISCSRGTYIRSLARDMGTALNSGGYLTELRRTRSGEFHVDNAVTIDELVSFRKQESER